MSENNPCLQDHELLLCLSGPGQNPVWDTHLNACERCRTRREQLQREIGDLKAALPDPDRTPFQAVFHPADPASADQEMPAAFGKYRVLGLAGVPGGQAIVYRADHPDLGRNVAVKVPRRPPKGSPAGAAALESMARRLKEEARVLAQLDHPGIAKVFDAAVSPPENGQDGCPYMVMEMVPGQTLRQYTAGRSLPHAEAAEIMAQVAEALAYAHSHGVTHLDVKPSNIMILENGKVKVIDFGLARLDQSSDDSGISGTPQYMSCEVASGTSEWIGPASDQFSAGAVLYELLEGSPPYAADTWQKSLEKAVQWNFNVESLRRSAAPRPLIDTCLKAMGKRPQDRYGDCTQLAAALRKAVRPVRWRLRAAVGAAAIAILLAVAAGVWVSANRRPESAKPSREPVQYLLKIDFGGKADWINKIYPVTTGLKFRVDCQVPKNLKLTVFWYDTSQGTLEEVQDVVQESSPEDTSDHILGKSYPFDAATSANFVFVCSSVHEKPTAAQVEPLVRATLAGPAALRLPPNNLVAMTSDRVVVETSKEKVRGYVHQEVYSSAFELEDRFEKLRLTLRKRFDFVAGVSFCQQER